jgi:ribose transport system ATP-binding protein
VTLKDTAQGRGSGASEDVLRIEGLSKHFGGALALDAVDLSVGRQEVHGLLGQNGSGKSTLIKVLSGFHAPDPGARLWVNGREVALPLPPGGFRALGISFVHQHLGLIPSLTVIENFIIGDIATEDRWRIDWKAEAERARELFDRYRLPIDPWDQVGHLSPVQRALLAIVRAFDQLRSARLLAGHGGLLILDEPTPFLPASDVEELFGLVREIVRDGASVIFVSHDIDEVMDITDRATVLRDGRVAGSFETRAITKDRIVEMIVGRRVEHRRAGSLTGVPGPARVRIDGLEGPVVRSFSTEVARGEVVGLTGLIGSGYADVVYHLYGAEPAQAGSLEIDGTIHDLPGLDPPALIKAGCVLIPGDRQNAGAVGALSVVDNLSLPVFGRITKRWAIRDSALWDNSMRLAERFDVRPRDPSLLLGSLSGGNQQKVVLAKWFQMEPRLILLDEPTQGVDVGAREQVFEVIREAAAAGACVLCASSDFEQLEAICDRVLVFNRGRVVAEIVGSAITKSTIAEHCYTSAEGARERAS